MPEVDVASAAQHPQRAGAESFGFKRAPIGQHGRIAGKQHEYLGRIGEAEVFQREIGQHVVGNVVDENEEQGEAAEEIDPEVAVRPYGEWTSVPLDGLLRRKDPHRNPRYDSTRLPVAGSVESSRKSRSGGTVTCSGCLAWRQR